jgi:alpha-galactosidase
MSDLSVCRALLDGNVLVLENDLIQRRYAWNHGHLISQQLVDKMTGHVWALAGDEPDVAFPGEEGAAADGDLAITPCPATPIRPAHLQVDVTTCLGRLELRRRFRLYPSCPAIACDVYLRGRPSGAWGSRCAVTMERLRIAAPHLRLQSVQFFDVTDHRNTLVASRSIVPYRADTRLPGNLLFVRDVLSDSEDGLFVLKEAPCSDVQLAYPGEDFVCKIGDIRVVGIGLEPEDVSATAWVRGYGFVTGVVSGGEFGLLMALRDYQEHIRIHKPDRDEMILLNTWGDRGQDTKIREAFALAELDRAARLGITHFQLDDGWQAGRTSNSAFAGGSLDNIWNHDDFWSPHPERFPRGLAPVVARARELGIELCVWFNPSKDASYAHWREDADTLIGLYSQYGIRTFKIDGVMVPDKQADVNLRAMFERVMDATEGRAAFNLDVTAGRRWGYHYGNEYGNIFLENRYTDWRNYYPHWTLRNLWMLSRYVPSQNLQIEFLNKWRNVELYPPDDPLVPCRVPFDYCFAITMIAQPLAWFEATGLPEEAFDIASLVCIYRQHQAQIHAGRILPVGEEPSGTSWTGFQTLRDGEGYIIVYRERNQRPEAGLRLWDLAGKEVRFTAIAGQGGDFTTIADADGLVQFALPASFTFALYQYEA